MAHSRREHYSIWMIFCALESHSGSGFCQTSVFYKLPLRVQSKGRSGHRLMNDLDVALSSSVEVENLHFWLKWLKFVTSANASPTFHDPSCINATEM